MENLNTFKGYDSIFAERLRFLMKQHSVKQIDLAEHLGLTRQAISKYADGSASPNIENLQIICKFFNVSSDYMIGLSNAESIVAEERLCSEFTGLDTNSVKVLNSLSRKKTEEEKIMIRLLNNILISKDGLIALSKNIAGCYNSYIREHKKDGVLLKIKNVAEFDYRTSKFLACDWFDEPIEDVVLSLCEEKRCNNGNENK